MLGVASAIVGVAAHAAAAAVTAIALFSLAIATTVAIAGTPDMLPRGAPLTGTEKKLLQKGVVGVCAAGVVLLVVAATTSVSSALLLIPASLAVVLGVIAVVIAIR
jgi:hypothetical protein